MKNKQYSALKIFHHTEYLECIYNQQRQAPIYIRLKPTNLCNQHCSYCTYGSGKDENKTNNRDSIVKTDMIPWNKMQEIIADFGAMGVKAITLSGGGEPLTYPKIIELIELIKQKDIDLSLITNGQLLNGKIASLFYDAKWVRISFDSPYEQEYMKLRNVSSSVFRTVYNNIKDFARNKSDNCILGINFVISKANYKSVFNAAKILSEMGVNNVKFAAVVDNGEDYHADIKESVINQIHMAQKEFTSDRFSIINNYEEDCNKNTHIGQSFSKCYICKLVTVIGADCNVYYCHTRAYESKAVLGNLRQESFRQMWFSEKTTKLLDNLNPISECKNFCVYEQRNKLIQNYYDIDYNHINFI